MLSRLRLRHFRNYQALDLHLERGLTVVLGDNGQGKTNLLEAVFYLSLLRSFRIREVRSLRQHGASHFFVGGEVLDAGGVDSRQLAVSYGERRLLRQNGKSVGNASDFINAFLCLAFSPDDMEIVKGNAAIRRRLADIALTQQLGHPYLLHLQNYLAALRRRNQMLRDYNRYGERGVRAYDNMLAVSAAEIIAARRLWVRQIGNLLQTSDEAACRLANEAYAMEYAPCVGGGEDEPKAILELMLNRFKTALDGDCRDGCTRYGPHRDDFSLLCNGQPLARFGSEGQCRMMSILLRLALMKLLRGTAAAAGKSLVVLVDDVIGELDENHREMLFSSMHSADQVLFACTAVPERIAGAAARVLRVHNGCLVE